MRIALDYDGTYTLDRAVWDALIFAAQDRGHEVMIVTMRHESEPVGDNASGAEPPCEVIYTGRKGKVKYMTGIGKPVDVWIDDSPHFLIYDAF